MLEFVSSPEQGLPPLDMDAQACLFGPQVAAVLYTPALTVQQIGVDGAVLVDDVLLDRAVSLGWVWTDDFAGWAAPSPGWHAALAGDHFTVSQPDHLNWYDGSLPATAAWREAARSTGRVFHFTASRSDTTRILDQIGTGQALAIVTLFTEDNTGLTS
ncbi:hypothetical protein CTZ27_30980 [Streptomyces griseocarneus]|nr:hypothetical protein CTZ27_30980 [Streptomyces griseocarneus]